MAYFLSYGFCYPKCSILILLSTFLSSAFFHPHFVIRIFSIRILSSAFFYPPSAIRRHPLRTLQIKTLKIVTSGLKMLPSACGLGQHFQALELGHSFSPYGPPSRQITYIRSPLLGVCNSHYKPMQRHFYRPVYF